MDTSAGTKLKEVKKKAECPQGERQIANGLAYTWSRMKPSREPALPTASGNLRTVVEGDEVLQA